MVHIDLVEMKLVKPGAKQKRQVSITHLMTLMEDGPAVTHGAFHIDPFKRRWRPPGQTRWFDFGMFIYSIERQKRGEGYTILGREGTEESMVVYRKSIADLTTEWLSLD